MTTNIADKTPKSMTCAIEFEIIIMVKNPRDGAWVCRAKRLINDANNLHLKMEKKEQERDKINSSNTLIFITLIYLGPEI